MEAIFLNAAEYCSQFPLDVRHCFKMSSIQFYFQFGKQSDPRDESWVLISLLSWLKTHIYVPLLLVMSRAREQTSWQCSTCLHFLLTSPGNLHNCSQRCLRAHRSLSSGLCG
jgi:hypothetical protein